MRATVIGTGYVGLVQGVCLAHLGHDVTCVDIDPAKIEMLRAGESPIYEPGIDELIAEGQQTGRLSFATPDAGWAELLSEVTFVAVGTPMSPNGAADLSFVRGVIEQIAAAATEPLTLVMKSTVPPGTGELLRTRYLGDAKVRVGYVSNPEFLREGQAIRDWLEPDRIVLGGELEDTEIVSLLYKGLETPVVVTDIASAETIKYASNAFLSTKISFINEMANLCDCVGADVDAVSEGIGLDMRIGSSFLHAGVGYGGSCFPKDTRALDFIATLAGYRFDLLRAVIDVNNRQRLLPVQYLTNRFGDLHERKIAILGLAFKPHTDDVRESPAVDVVSLLAEEGCRIDIYDPLAAELELPCARRVGSVSDALEGASAVLLLTEWPEFLDIDWNHAAKALADDAVVFDGRNCLDASAVRAAGLAYAAIGRAGDHRRSR